MRWAASAAVAAACLAALAGCGPRHQLSHLPNGDGTLSAVVDYMPTSFGLARDAVVSVQEPHSLATLIATFHNVQDLEVSWLGPEDLTICQHGSVVGYKTEVTLNTSKGMRTVHVHYGC